MNPKMIVFLDSAAEEKKKNPKAAFNGITLDLAYVYEATFAKELAHSTRFCKRSADVSNFKA